MGTHPSGPSVLVGKNAPELNNVTLQNCLLTFPEYFGNINLFKKYSNELPFLFKVLSIENALSIQAHPNKQLAEQLHTTDPFHYPDSNHKPELAIALTHFEALCGFKQILEIEFVLENVPEFRQVVSAELADEFVSADDKTTALQKLFTTLMNADEQLINEKLNALLERWSAHEETNGYLAMLQKLFLKLANDFPGDIGLFSVFFLNHLVLPPGDAIYINADEPHAYLSGDCIECMACSDNVVRAGLTPKFKDISTLCSMLTYQTGAPYEHHLYPIAADQFTNSYIAPVSEFTVDSIQIPTEALTPLFEYKLEAKESASILIVINGEAVVQEQTLFPGFAAFIPAQTWLIVEKVKSPMLMYRAYFRL